MLHSLPSRTRPSKMDVLRVLTAAILTRTGDIIRETMGDPATETGGSKY
jgi:hypothetical protein